MNLRFAVFLAKSMCHKSECYILTKNIQFSFFIIIISVMRIAMLPSNPVFRTTILREVPQRRVCPHGKQDFFCSKNSGCDISMELVAI